ncbi:WD repeat-containing protein 55 [Glycine max]|nr:WD repeat-containing protein 55 [Glycine max]
MDEMKLFDLRDNLVAAGLITGHLHLYRYSPDTVPVRLLEVHAHTESCRAARFINSGRGSSDCSILATDVETGSTIARVDNAHESAVNRLINLTESTVVSGDNDGCIKAQARSEFSEDELLSVVLMKLNEDRIITGSENRIINLVGILPNRVIQPIAEHSEYPVEGLAFSHDRKFLGSIAYDQIYGTWIIYCKVQETKTNSSGVIDSDDDEMDLDGNKRNNGHAVGCSNKFFVDL